MQGLTVQLWASVWAQLARKFWGVGTMTGASLGGAHAGLKPCPKVIAGLWGLQGTDP